MKRYLAIEKKADGEYAVTFSAENDADAEFACSEAGYLFEGELEFCGEITDSYSGHMKKPEDPYEDMWENYHGA